MPSWSHTLRLTNLTTGQSATITASSPDALVAFAFEALCDIASDLDAEIEVVEVPYDA